MLVRPWQGTTRVAIGRDRGEGDYVPTSHRRGLYHRAGPASQCPRQGGTMWGLAEQVPLGTPQAPAPHSRQRG